MDEPWYFIIPLNFYALNNILLLLLSLLFLIPSLKDMIDTKFPTQFFIWAYSEEFFCDQLVFYFGLQYLQLFYVERFIFAFKDHKISFSNI